MGVGDATDFADNRLSLNRLDALLLKRPLSVWFATPAYGRYEITDLCLAQRQHLRSRARAFGIQFNSVVVADDENLKIAERRGFPVVEQDNVWLGRRWNDGFVYALEQGADFVAPVDSDSWVHPDYLTTGHLYADTIRSGNHLALIDANGRSVHHWDVGHPFGLGPLLIPRGVLEGLDGRPITEQLARGVSTSIYSNLRAAFDSLRFEFLNVHRFQYVSVRSPARDQITQQERGSKWQVGQDDDPWQALAGWYPKRVLADTKAFYDKRRGGYRGAHRMRGGGQYRTIRKVTR